MTSELNLNLTPGLGTHFGIVLLFNSTPSVIKQAVFGSKFHQKFGEDPTWELNQKVKGVVRHIPHLSLLHLDITPTALVKCIEHVRDIAENTCSFQGAFSSVRVFGDGWLFWLTPRTPELNTLHEQVLRTCAPLRSGNVSDIDTSMSLVQQLMITQHGFTNTGYCWNPHITLCKLDPKKMRQVQPTEDLIEACFDTIAVVEIGRFGAAERIVCSFPFL